jgi:hypothetical protein
LQNVTVSVYVTEAIVASSTICGETSGDNGFSMQLNVNSPNILQGSLETESTWQQYIIIEGQTGLTGGSNNLTVHTQLFANTQGDGQSIPEQILPVPGMPLPNFTIPAGYTLTWNLATNSTSGNVTEVTYSVTDPQGGSGSYTQAIGLAYQAPIAAFQLDFVGQPGGCGVTFQSGAGMITYTSSTQFTAQNNGYQSCEVGTRGIDQTSETSTDSVYGQMASGQSTSFTQAFSAYPPGSVYPLGTCENPIAM